MSETYYVGAYWGARKESAGECARRMEVFLKELAQVDPLFTRWFKSARSRKQMLQRPLEIELAPLQAYFQRNLMRDDMRVPMEELGFSVGLWNGGSGDEDVNLYLACGGCCAGLPNFCLMHPPHTEAGLERAASGTVFSGVLRAMALGWDPDWGVAMSHAHRDLLSPPDSKEDPGILIGGVTYLARRLGTVPPLPAPVRIEPVAEQGTLLVLTPERFTASNPEHVALARRVRELLHRAGVWPQASLPPRTS
jgi:hypothetical protein